MLTVTEVVSANEKELPGKGTFVSYKLKFDDGKIAELFQRKDTVPPKAGDQIDGTLEQSQYGLKVKKNAKIGGGGFRPRDPRETAAIQRQHSQSVTVEYLKAKIAAGALEHFPSLDELAVAIDWFQRDIQRGVNLEQYGSKEEKRKEPVRTGKSDIPANPDDFQHATPAGERALS